VECCVLFLTKEKQAIINARFYDKFSKFKYCAQQTRYPGKFYIVRRNNGKFVFLHREILEMSADDKRFVDHINGNTLDNRVENLRFASPSQNGMNAKLSKANTSGFKGVTFNKRKEKWMAQIRFDGKNQFLGYFYTPEEAHTAYCEAATRLCGEFANFGH
jgi:hypothetical protein